MVVMMRQSLRYVCLISVHFMVVTFLMGIMGFVFEFLLMGIAAEVLIGAASLSIIIMWVATNVSIWRGCS